MRKSLLSYLGLIPAKNLFQIYVATAAMDAIRLHLILK